MAGFLEYNRWFAVPDGGLLGALLVTDAFGINFTLAVRGS